MTNMPNVFQPTSDRVHEQVALYEATDEREGGTLEGRPVVILTRNSGSRPVTRRFL
jgi:hypothetical protein